MKKHILCIAAVISFLASACGGGGGGGGGGGVSGATVTAAPQAEYAIFAAPQSSINGTIERDGNINNPLDDYIHIYRDDEGLVYQYRDVANRGLLDDSQTLRTVRFATGNGNTANAFQMSGDYLKATAVTNYNVSNAVYNGASHTGQFTVTDSLEYGGKQLGLSYADFGMWKTKGKFTGTIAGAGAAFESLNDPDKWTNGRDASEAYFAASGTGDATYSGNAMGVARTYTGYNSDVAAQQFHEFYGSADMKVNLQSRTASLDLKFDNFYNFSFTNLSVADRDGEIDDDRATLNITANGTNSSNVNFTTGSSSSGFDVDGQFYGPSRTNPTEVVGEVEIRQSQGGSRTEADIVFGAKKP